MSGGLPLDEWTFWRRRDPVLSLALFVAATFLFSPRMFNYDMVVFGFIVALLRQRNDNTVADDRLAIAVWMLPVAVLLFGAARIPIAMIVLPAFAGRLIWRLCRGDVRHIAGGETSGDASAPRVAALVAQ